MPAPALRSLFLIASLAVLSSCSSSTPKPPDAPQDAPSSDPGADPAPTGKPEGDEASTPQAMGTVKRPAGAEDVPDDYSLTENDCDALGKGYGDAARSDQRTALNPKLSDKQREQAMNSIDAAVSKIESQWIDNCMRSLAGKVVNHDNIKCALGSKTVKAFDICLNGEKGTPQASPKKK